MDEFGEDRARHGPSCRTHMSSMMPVYGSDCTCGGDWSAEQQLRALFEHVLISTPVELELVQLVAARLVEANYFEARKGTLARRAQDIEEGLDVGD